MRSALIEEQVYPYEPGMHEPKSLRASVETSLAELKTDSVDIFYLHAADRSVPFEKTLETINELYEEGKFKQFGLSNYTAFEVAEIVMTCREQRWVRPTIYQAMYNAISMSSPRVLNEAYTTVARSIEAELIPACRRYGLDIVTYNG
jgi:aflatoxin B1 aldehyde reductase